MKNDQSIVIIEDDQIDAMTFQRALKDIGVKNKIEHFENGEIALEYLKDANNQRPCIILLDLNMPRMNGIEFLKLIKQNYRLKSIPVVVVTTSTDHRDRSESFEQSVAGYMVKPVDYGAFVEMMKTISKYWQRSELP